MTLQFPEGYRDPAGRTAPVERLFSDIVALAGAGKPVDPTRMTFAHYDSPLGQIDSTDSGLVKVRAQFGNAAKGYFFETPTYFELAAIDGGRDIEVLGIADDPNKFRGFYAWSYGRTVPLTADMGVRTREIHGMIDSFYARFGVAGLVNRVKQRSL
jgi:hypothetical protein